MCYSPFGLTDECALTVPTPGAPTNLVPQVFDYDRFLEKLTVVSGEGDDLSTHLTANTDDILSQNQLSRADSMAMAASRMARKARN